MSAPRHAICEEWTEHPCRTRCWRVGVATDCPNGVCEECGMRRSRDDERAHAGFTYGQLRAARQALGAELMRRAAAGATEARFDDPTLRPLLDAAAAAGDPRPTPGGPDHA